VVLPGTPVPPFGVVVVDDVVVGPLVVVGSVSVAVLGLLVVPVFPESLESSAATMIKATPSPITRATRMPTIQRVRVSTSATVVGVSEGSGSVQRAAEDFERLVDLGLADHEGR
jgi:hypothetical protein